MLMKKENWLFSWILVVFLLLTSCGVNADPNLKKSIESALESRCMQENEDQQKRYYAYDLLGIDKDGEYVKAYLMVSSVGFDSNGEISWGGKDIPTVLIFANDGKYTFIDYRETYEGEAYADSVRELFPAYLVNRVFYYNGDEMFNRLEKNAKEDWTKRY